MKENNTYHEGMDDLNLPESLRVNPFSVPPDYFEGLSAKTNTLVYLDKVNQGMPSFAVPTNYFENLSETIQAQVCLAKNLDSAINVGMKVPANYFDQLSAKIQTHAKLSSILDKKSQTVPPHYFETLSEQIQHRIQESQLQEKAKTTGFITPEGYFDALTKSITAQTEQGAKVHSLPQRGFQKWIQYAAAACVTTLLGIGSYYAVINQNQVPVQQEQLASVSDAEILNYLAYSMDSNDLMYVMESIYQPEDEEEVVKHVDKDDIKDYLKYML